MKVKNGLTKRAPDVWDSAAFSSIFLALSFSCFEGESTLPPTAANASRWAQKENIMSRDLGNPIAYGRTSEIYSWDQDHVLKLFYDWVDLESIENESHISHAIHESGLPVPEVSEIVRVNERMGLIYQRINGDSMWKLMQRKPWLVPKYFRRAAELQAEIHSRNISTELPSQRQILESSIQQARALPDDLRLKVLASLSTLPDGDQLCHGDFWGGNILITPQREFIIDWHNSSRGNPLADLARSVASALAAVKSKQFKSRNLSYGNSVFSQLKNLTLQMVIWISFRVYVHRYFQIRPGGEEEYHRWLPIIAAARLSRNIPELEKVLIKQIEKSL